MARSQFGHLPSLTNGDIQEFTPSALAAAEGYQTWFKPRGASMIYMLALSSGGGGGAGMTGATATVRCGGGGGGAGARSVLLMPAIYVPDVLYIRVGLGGAGGVNVAGTAGSRSFITARVNSVTLTDLFLESDAGNAGGGGKGTTAVGAAGAAGAAATASWPCAWASFFNAIAGQAGGASGAIGGAKGVSVAYGARSNIGSGGAGGGSTPAANTNFAGGNITGTGIVPTLTGAAGGTSNPGPSGYTFNYGGLRMAIGGSGGGTGGAGTAGKGGDGGLGSGGGGGGGGITRGDGGRGGGGLVCIITM